MLLNTEVHLWVSENRERGKKTIKSITNTNTTIVSFTRGMNIQNNGDSEHSSRDTNHHSVDEIFIMKALIIETTQKLNNQVTSG